MFEISRTTSAIVQELVMNLKPGIVLSDGDTLHLAINGGHSALYGELSNHLIRFLVSDYGITWTERCGMTEN